MPTTDRSIFWEIHSGLPREGPGDNASTRKAFLMTSSLPATPRILDIACGPGMQTIEIALVSRGDIVAIDTHQPFLDELNRRIENTEVAGQITTVRASMFALPFAPCIFDLIWCEGAMYMMGFQRALVAWNQFLKPQGNIAVTEPCWLSDPPAEVKEFWSEYPGMTTVAETQRIIRENGFREIGHFVLPDSAWWTDYYAPMEVRLKALRQRCCDDHDALKVIEESEREIQMRRSYPDTYGYVFFVMKRA